MSSNCCILGPIQESVASPISQQPSARHSPPVRASHSSAHGSSAQHSSLPTSVRSESSALAHASLASFSSSSSSPSPVVRNATWSSVTSDMPADTPAEPTIQTDIRTIFSAVRSRPLPVSTPSTSSPVGLRQNTDLQDSTDPSSSVPPSDLEVSTTVTAGDKPRAVKKRKHSNESSESRAQRKWTNQEVSLLTSLMQRGFSVQSMVDTFRRESAKTGTIHSRNYDEIKGKRGRLAKTNSK